MNKYLYIAVASLVIGTSGCNLNEEPEHAITTGNLYKTEQGINAAQAATMIFMGNSVRASFPHLMAGELVKPTHSTEIQEWAPRTIYDNTIDWEGFYGMIMSALGILDNIGETTGLTEERSTFYIGQAKFALGIGYYNLAQRYGSAVILKDSHNFDPYTTSPTVEVLDKAIEYATEAFELLPTYDKLVGYGGTKISSKQFGSKGSAATLLAELYAWKGSLIDLLGLKGDAKECYTNAVKYASKVIAGEVGNYQLHGSPDELCKALSNPGEFDAEDIFSITLDRNAQNTNTASPAQYYLQKSWPVNKLCNQQSLQEAEFYISPEIVENLFPDHNDLRRGAYFYKLDENLSSQYAYIYKWRKALYLPDPYSESGESFRSADTNYVVWRLGGLMLLRAECYAKLGQTADAVTDLNSIRSRAQAKAYPADGETDLQRAIFTERERELFAEGHRFFDIIRNGYLSTEFHGNLRTMTRQQMKDGGIFFPIPIGAFKVDDKLVNTIIRQHPYWMPYAQ